MAAGRIVLPGWMPALDSNGAPIPNAQIYIYLNGTTTLATVYSDDTLTTPIANPVAANSSGQFPEIWADDANLFSISVDAPFGPPGIPFAFDSIGPATASAVIEVATEAGTAAAIAALPSAVPLVNVIASGASAPLSIEDRFGKRVDVIDHGALIDGTTNAAPAIQALRDQIIGLGGGVIRLNETRGGAFSISSRLDLTVSNGAPVSLIGEGGEQTRLRFRAGCGGGWRFRSTSTNPNIKPRVTIQGVGFYASDNALPWAIDNEWADANDIERPLFMDDVVVAQWLDDAADSGGGFGYWQDHIRTANARNAIFRNGVILGELDRVSTTGTQYAMDGGQSRHAFLMEGECTDFKISDYEILEVLSTYMQTGATEGGQFNDVSAIYTAYGMDFGGATTLEPQFEFKGGTINAFVRCLRGAASRYNRFETFLFAAKGKNALMPSANWTGVEITGSISRAHKIDVICTKEDGQGNPNNGVTDWTLGGGTNAATSTCVDVKAGGLMEIDLLAHGFSGSDPIDYGVRLRSGTERITATVMADNVTTPVDDQGTNNGVIEYGTDGWVRFSKGMGIGGDLTVPNNTFIRYRNAANTDWVYALQVNAGDNVGIGVTNAGLVLMGAPTLPTTDNNKSLGGASNRWSTVYAGTGTINTSDARKKTIEGEADPAFLEAILSVPMVQYRWNDAVEAKGDKARIHYGPTAQGVRDALIDAGFDPSRYALFCEDEVTEMVDDVLVPTGERVLGLRLDQFDRYRAEAVRILCKST